MSIDHKQTVAWNTSRSNEYKWENSGEEWSNEWGGSVYQWQLTVFPRIMQFLPAANVLEIAPGYGRWTRFLLTKCSRYVGLDILDKAIDQCRNRFAFEKHAQFLVNDGLTFEHVKNKSIDFVFSMDSLVHAELDAIDSYLKECSRVFSDSGVGFIHHSNLANHKDAPNRHDRAKSVSAELFRNACEKYDLVCLSQEKINWGQTETNDCFSLFTRKSIAPNVETKVFENSNFDKEITHSKKLETLYNSSDLKNHMI